MVKVVSSEKYSLVSIRRSRYLSVIHLSYLSKVHSERIQSRHQSSTEKFKTEWTSQGDLAESSKCFSYCIAVSGHWDPSWRMRTIFAVYLSISGFCPLNFPSRVRDTGTAGAVSKVLIDLPLCLAGANVGRGETLRRHQTCY